jgi:hypothetical protein
VIPSTKQPVTDATQSQKIGDPDNYIWLYLCIAALCEDEDLRDKYHTFIIDKTATTNGDIRLGDVFLSQLVLYGQQLRPTIQYEVPEKMMLPTYSFRFMLRSLLQHFSRVPTMSPGFPSAQSVGGEMDRDRCDGTMGQGEVICAGQVQVMLLQLYDLLRDHGPRCDMKRYQ